MGTVENFRRERTSVTSVRTRVGLLIGVLVFSACDSAGAPPARLDVAPTPAPAEEPVPDLPDVAPPTLDPPLDASTPLLPSPGQLYPQTQVRLVPGDPSDADMLADVRTCGGCHPDVLSSWRSSAHARASFDNPWYRQAVENLRDEEGGRERSRFCAGCHDPVMLVAGDLTEAIRPSDPRAHAGITCRVCHGAQEARSDGNGSYTLSTREIFLPDPADPEEVRRHVAAVTPEPLRTAALCGSCHRGFLGPDMGNPHHLGGIDDLTPWQRSGFAHSAATRVDEPFEAQTCQGCHMPMGDAPEGDFAADEQGQIHLHRFAGAHTALAGATGDTEQLAAAQASIVGAARIDVAAARTRDHRRRWLPADGAAIRSGDAIELDVVVRNLEAGHRFPGGTLDAQDTWIEVEVRDADGAMVAEAGTRHADGPEDDPTAHRLVAMLADDHAQAQVTHHPQHFRAKVWDHTLGPRDAAVIRYALDVPRGAHFPFSVRARLRHRRHSRALATAACESQRTPRGRAFTAASRELGNAPIDACAPQPITEVDEALVWIGAGAAGHEASGGATAPRWRRLFDHALGLIGDVQEHLDEARPSLAAALDAAPGARARAMVFTQRARLEGRQGRLDAALADVDRAEALIGAQPSLHRMRGDAYAQVWRWEDAEREYAAAADGAPGDDSRWADLARARGSAADDVGALEAARRGLAISPRDESMLRSQYLALSRLEREGVDPAREAYVNHRIPDELPALRLRCGQESEECARERLPVHTHELRPAAAP